MQIPKDRGGTAEAGSDTAGSDMAGIDEAETAALWRHWQALAPDGGIEEPDFLEMAAFAEGRTVEADSGRVDSWLAARPELIDDIVAARAADEAASEAPADHLLARAMALVAAPADRVVPLRRAAPRVAMGWRGAVARGGIAASLVATSLVGFALGDNAWTTLQGERQSAGYQDLFDAPAGIFTGITEDEGI